MRNVLGWASALLLAAGLSAGAAGTGCDDSSAPAPLAAAPLDAGVDAPVDSPAPGAVSITISPVMANVLTCSTQIFTATVMGPTDTSVSWSVALPGTGTVDTNGKYTGPTTTPQPPTATVTATPLADLSASASATVTLATAFVGKTAPIGGSATTAELASRVGVYPHSVAANGKRAYGVWPSNPAGATTVSMKIARSDDGGTTWNAPKVAITATLKSPQTTTDAWIECPAIAVDPTNPDIVYVVGKITGSSSLAAGVGADGQTTALAVSKDGGATFTTRVLHVGAGDTCPDLAAPATNTVVVEAPALGDCAAGDPDLRIWSDAANGAGFATGSGTAPYLAAGLTLALANVNKAPTCATRIVVAQNGTTGTGGEATEAPRLFTNGKGRLCITYVGSIVPGDGTTTTNAYVQCSGDAGRTFSDPVNLDPTRAQTIDHSSAIGAFAPDGNVAVLWTNSPDATNQKALPYVAVSNDGGRTFSAPALVPTYVVPGGGAPVPVVNPDVVFDASGILWLTYRSSDGGPDRILVDKSCDEGKTWSGAVLVNGPESAVASNGMKWPALFVTDAAAPSIVASASGALTAFALIP
jgi:hypothetical protein